MPRPDLTRVPEFYHNYIKQVPENDRLPLLKTRHRQSFIFFKTFLLIKLIMPTLKANGRSGKFCNTLLMRKECSRTGHFVLQERIPLPFPALMKISLQKMLRLTNETGMIFWNNLKLCVRQLNGCMVLLMKIS